VAGLSSGDEFMVGNPYLSSINMVKFLRDNKATLSPEFKVWNGKTFSSYQVNLDDGSVTTTVPDEKNSGLIAPLQGFFLKIKDGYVENQDQTVATFHVENISEVRSKGTPSNLRSAKETKEENILRIKAENSFAASHTLIGCKENASADFVRGEDVRKLFSPHSAVPEIYSLAGETPLDINFFNAGGEMIVPLGIKTGRKGEIRLTITGMDNYFKASKIEWIDALENGTTDLTGKPSYTLTFNHQETGIQNGRFSLRISRSTTALPEVANPDNLHVYGDSKGIYVVSSASDPVQQVIVYDLQGRKVFESKINAGYYPLQGNFGQSPLIVKVITKNGTKTVKINCKL